MTPKLLCKYAVTVVFIALVACQPKSPYEGFSRTRWGLDYKLLKIGESTENSFPGDFITADFTYLTNSDSVFFAGRRKVKLEAAADKKGIEECMLMLHEGDEALFIIDAYDFFHRTLESTLPAFIDSGSIMKVKINLQEIQTHQEFENEKLAFLNWIDDFGDYEKEVLRQFIKAEHMTAEPIGSGIYFLKLNEGDGGKCIEEGDTITIHYEGRFKNGKFFDSTVERNEPFQFVFGTEWQVIKGIEEGLRHMCQGQRALIIIPSEMAFGQKGSSTGIVPAFTSVVYEVKVLKINS